MNGDIEEEKKQTNVEEIQLIKKARKAMDQEPSTATEEQLCLLVMRGYSKRAMEKYFSIKSVNEQFLKNAQTIKNRGYTCYKQKYRIPLTREEVKERERVYRQEVDNLVECAILVRDHNPVSVPNPPSSLSVSLKKTKGIKKQKK